MKHLVVGSSGLIGSNLKKKLELEYGNENVQSTSNKLSEINSNTIFYDLSQNSNILNLIFPFSPDVIYITAGLSNRTICNKDPKVCLKVNYLQQKKIILDCLGLNARIKIVMLSSSTVYPEITYNNKIKESQGIKYFDCYSESKFLIEDFINNLDKNSRQQIKIIRPFFIYGPGKHTDLIGSWFYKIKDIGLNAKLHVGNLKLIRDFLFIDDCVNALIKIAETESIYNTYNICSGQPTLLNDLLNMILSISEFRGKVESSIDLDRGAEHIFRVGDNSRLIELGWTQQVSLKEGLEKTFESLHRSRL